MTAIVVNLVTAAVTEYDWTFAALCSTHAGSEDGLFELGGTDDDGAAIDSSWDTGVTLREGTLKKALDCAYLAMRGAAGSRGVFVVHTPAESYEYEFEVGEGGVSRAKLGRGIKENFLGFGYRNQDGAYFAIDRVEIPLNASEQRRI